MIIENEFELGQIVYLITDIDSHARMVTRMQISLNGNIQYCLSFGAVDTWHYAKELSTEKVIN